jgi:hypothetical protein
MVGPYSRGLSLQLLRPHTTFSDLKAWVYQPRFIYFTYLCFIQNKPRQLSKISDQPMDWESRSPVFEARWEQETVIFFTEFRPSVEAPRGVDAWSYISTPPICLHGVILDQSQKSPPIKSIRKLSLCLIKHHAMKTCGGSGRVAPRILSLYTRCRLSVVQMIWWIKWIEKDVEGIGIYLISDITPDFDGRLKKWRKTSIGIADLRAETWTRDHLNTKQYYWPLDNDICHQAKFTSWWHHL